MNRLYLDFDGVVAPIQPKVENEADWVAVNMPYTGLELIRKDVIKFLKGFPGEIVWITHRDPEDMKHFCEVVGLPVYDHLTFDDPTGSKVGAIWEHFKDDALLYPDKAAVVDDGLKGREARCLVRFASVHIPRSDYGLHIASFTENLLGDQE